MLKQKLADMYGTFAELLSWQCDRLPFGAAAFHELAVVLKLDAKEQVLIRVGVEIIPAVKIHVDVLHFIGKDKYCLVAFAEDSLPPCQTLDIPDSDPAFESR